MGDLNLPVRLAGVQLGNVLMNGAYIGSKTFKDVEALAGSAAGAVVVGSISIKPRKPNPGPGYWLHKDHFYSLNSYGLPNGGLIYFQDQLPKMVKLVHSHGKPFIANVVGFSDDEFVQLVRLADESGADMAELNLGCPNAWDGGKQKQIISYHASLVRSVLAAIAKQQPKIALSVKISPLPPDTLRDVAQVIASFDIVQAVTATNSYPNAAVTSDTGQGDGSGSVLAGLAGSALKPIGVGIVRQLRQLLPSRVAIIGCGGVGSARDVQDYLQAGASAVQIATALVEEGPGLFQKIMTGINDSQTETQTKK